MAKSMAELAAEGYPAALSEVCDHEQRIALLEEDMARTNVELAQLRIQLDEWAKRIVACGIRPQ